MDSSNIKDLNPSNLCDRLAELHNNTYCDDDSFRIAEEEGILTLKELSGVKVISRNEYNEILKNCIIQN